MRDAGLSMKAYIDINDGDIAKISTVCKAYVGWVKKVQNQADPNSIDVRIEPKFTIPDGKPYTGGWWGGINRLEWVALLVIWRNIDFLCTQRVFCPRVFCSNLYTVLVILLLLLSSQFLVSSQLIVSQRISTNIYEYLIQYLK
jgi:hypothetical protein